MTIDGGAEVSRPENLGEIVVGLQAQIDDLTAVLESHQQLFEQLRAQGVLVADNDGVPS